MPSKKRENWAKIKAEYIAGGISQRKLAAKYRIPFSTLRDRANVEKWTAEREYSRNKIVAKAVQKTADAAASNAAKSEKARGILIDQLIKAIENMPENGGTYARRYIGDGNKKVTVDYDLLDMVTALEKLSRDDNDKTGDQVTIIWGR